MALAGGVCSANQTIYRFLAIDGPDIPDTVSNPAEPDSTLPPVETLARGEPGGPFTDFKYASFQGTEAFVPVKFAGTPPLEEGFTVSAFLRFSDRQKNQVIASSISTTTGNGFRLSIDDDGRLLGQLTGRNDTSETKIWSVSPSRSVSSGVWYQVTYRFGRAPEGGEWFHDIWIDHHQAGHESLGAAFAYMPSSHAPVFGAERSDDGLDNHLVADVFAIEVDDYARRDFFLATPVVRDGSSYFGQIAFHEYLGLEPAEGKAGGVPLEQRIHDTYFDESGLPIHSDLAQRLENLYGIPFLNDSYVPQGFAWDQENKRIFLAYYHRTQDNIQHLHPSLIAEVFIPEGRLGNVLLLHTESGDPMSSHVGGIAYWNGFLFAPSEGDSTDLDPDLFVYDISEIPASSFNPATMEGFAPIELHALKRLQDPLSVLGPEGRFNSLSFMGVHYSADGQPFFHTGNFQQEPRPTHIFKLRSEQDHRGRYPVISEPVTLMQSHRRAQGMSIYVDVEASGRQVKRALLSNSWGDNNSTLFSSLYLDSPNPSTALPFISLPAGMEDLGRNGSQLMTWFESGAVYYQKRDRNPWQQLFPYIASINIGDLIDTTGNGISDEWLLHRKLAPGIDPASDPDMDGFGVLEEYFWGTDPKEPGSYPLVQHTVDPPKFRLFTSSDRFYTFEQTQNFVHWQPVPGNSRVRGLGGVMEFQANEPQSGTFYRIWVEIE